MGKYRFSQAAALWFSFIRNDNVATNNNEVSLTGSSASEVQKLENFKKFGLNIDTLENFPIEVNGNTKTINVIKKIDKIQNQGVLQILVKELLGQNYMKVNTSDPELNVLELLMRWFRREGTKPVTCQVLANTLVHRKVDMKKLAEMVMSTCRKYEMLNASSKPAPFLVYAWNVSDEYRQSHVIDKELWVQTRQPKENVRFVPLSLKHKHSSISLEDVFRGIKTSSRVLFTGRPGSGKSTLTRYLSKVLVDAESFDLVVRVHLGINQKIGSLESLLRAGTDNYYKATQINTIVKYLEVTEGSNVCFLLDGYDEYLPSQDSSDYVNQLIHKHVLRASVVIMTSHPMAVKSIKSNFNYHIEVIGFSDDGIKTFLEQFNLPKVEDKIYRYFSLHPNVHQMCYLPLHLSMLVYIATNPVGTGTLDKVDTETLLYFHFLALTLKQYEQFNDKHVYSLFDCYEDLVSSNGFCILLQRLSKISFEGILEKRQTFSIRDFDGLPSSINVSAELKGLSFFEVDITYDKNGAKSEKYSYSHPTFQEFLGAFHLATIAKMSQTSFMELHWTHEMYKFSLGLMSKVLKFDYEVVLRSFVSYGRIILATYQNHELHVMKCAHEIGSGHQFISALKDVAVIDRSDSLQMFTVSSLDCWYIGYTLTQSPIHELGIDNFSELDLCVSSLTNYIHLDAAGKRKVNISKLRLGHRISSYWPHSTKLESEINVTKLLEVVPLLQDDLTYLGLRHVKFESDESIMWVGNILKQFNNLKNLELSLNASLVKEGHLERALKKIPQLEHLEMGLTNGYNEDTVIPDDIFEFLRLDGVRSLAIHISWNKKLADVNLTSLIGGLVHMTGLKKLSIFIILYNGLRADGAAELLQGVKLLSNIREFELSLDLCWGAGLGNVTLKELLEELSPLLRKLTLCIDFNFSDMKGSTGILDLAEGLKTLTHLHMLSLELRWERNDGDDKDESTIAIADSVKNLQNLRSLYLNLGDIGRLNKLTPLFQSLTRLQEFSIGWKLRSLVVDTEVPKLLDDLKVLKNLTKLDLSSNAITDQDILSLSEALENMNFLRTLDLSHNKIGDNGVLLLAEVIARNLPNLEELILNYNNITNSGARHLPEILGKHTKLHNIELDLKLGNYSVQTLLPQKPVRAVLVHSLTLMFPSVMVVILIMIVTLIALINITQKVSLAHSRQILDVKIKPSLPNLPLSQPTFTSSPITRQSMKSFKLSLSRRKNFPYSAALSQGFFTTLSAWRLDRLDKYKLDGTGNVIAILDTAVYDNCPLLKFVQIEARHDLSSVSTKLHGSACAIVAAGSPSVNPRAPRGVAPGAKVLVYRVADGNDREACCTNEAVLFALEDIRNKMSAHPPLKVDVVSISYDLEDDNKVNDIRDKIRELTKEGVVFVAAVGNRGRYRKEAAIPASFEEVISVGSLDEHGDESKSNPDVPMDIRAPGKLALPAPFDEISGSSLAAPAIGGVVLLLKQWAKEIGPPASRKIHRVEVLKAIFNNHITIYSSQGSRPVSAPVDFLIEIMKNRQQLQDIVLRITLEEPMKV